MIEMTAITMKMMIEYALGEAVVAGLARERHLVDHRDEDVGEADRDRRVAVTRAAVRQHVDDVEVVEVERERRDEERRDGDEQQRELDQPEHRPRPRAVDRRRLLQLLGDRLQRAHAHEEHVGEPEPEVHDEHRDLGQHRIGEPRHVGAAEQHLVDEAEALVHHARPDEGGQERRDGVGQDHRHPVPPAPAHPHVVEDDREEQPQEERRGHRDEREREGPERHVDERPGQARVGDGAHEVVEADGDLPAGQQLLAVVGREGAGADVGVDGARRDIRHRAGGLVVLERRDVLVGVRAVGRAQRAVVRIVGERHRELGDLVGAGEHVGEAEGRPAVDGDGLAALHLGVDRLERGWSFVPTYASPSGSVARSPSVPRRSTTVTGIGGRVLDALERRGHERRDRLLLRAVVARAVVGEGDVPRVDEHEHLEDHEEDHARREVLRRELAAREVDPVDDRRDDGDDRRDEPLAARRRARARRIPRSRRGCRASRS